MDKLNYNILNLLCDVAKKLQHSKLSETKLKPVAPKLEKLNQFFHTEAIETELLVVIASECLCHGECDIEDVALYLDVTQLDIIRYKKEIDDLYNKGYLRKRHHQMVDVEIKSANFALSNTIYNAIINNSEIDFDSMNPEETAIDVYKFVSIISDFIEQRGEDDISTRELLLHVKQLEVENESLPFINKVTSTVKDVAHRTLFYEICDDLISMVNGDKGTNIDNTLSDIYDKVPVRLQQAKLLKSQSHPLIELGWVELGEAEFFTDSTLNLSENGMRLFLGNEADLYIRNSVKNKDLIEPDKIADKKMFYNSELEKQIESLRNSLKEEKYNLLRARLKEKCMPEGVAAIFYGAPGTGKTETANQIAKATGRSIYHVDISQTKSMWFGESEKKIKEVFVNYKKMCDTIKPTPILLFNEADAVFGKRKDNNASNTAQTENAIQNIILEEMERIDGILIATTNLAVNLDTAFERRFLFKIKFDMPSLEAKCNIWKNKLEWLTDEEAQRLAKGFNFSGGEIDNIVRKAIIEEVLNEERPNIDRLITICRQEKMSNNASSVGYKLAK